MEEEGEQREGKGEGERKVEKSSAKLLKIVSFLPWLFV